jgi:hypothetical protein
MTDDTQGPLAGIQYHGIAGASLECEAAVLRLLFSDGVLARAVLLTARHDHAFLLFTQVGDPIAVKSGFASGYSGTGPAALSTVLQLLWRHGVDIEELEVTVPFLERLDAAALTLADVEAIERGAPLRPSRWGDYIRSAEQEASDADTLWSFQRPAMPYALLDPRMIDLALDFASDPDARLNCGYRRLEDSVRARTGLKLHGAKLFSTAFQGETPRLVWDVPDPSETSGRAQLFTGAFMAYRNPRAHREPSYGRHLAEFLLLNQLFRLEAEAVANPATASEGETVDGN